VAAAEKYIRASYRERFAETAPAHDHFPFQKPKTKFKFLIKNLVKFLLNLTIPTKKKKMSTDPTTTVYPERPEKTRFKNTISGLKREFDTLKSKNRILESQVQTLTGQKESLEFSDIENKSEIERLQGLYDREKSFKPIGCDGKGQVSVLLEK
jgi:FtsZ-binding cell division protein ZapB